MPTNKIAETLQIALSVCIAASLLAAGCGRKETAPLSDAAENSSANAPAKPAEAPLELQTEQKLEPLTAQDAELYLSVMRAAAERVKNPTAADQTALRDAAKILTEAAAGRLPTSADANTLARATMLATARDQAVAEERKLDLRAYRGIAEAIETVIPDPALPVPPAAAAPQPLHAPTPLELRLAAVNAANEKFLAPYRQEIQALLGVVRNPGNLPKS